MLRARVAGRHQSVPTSSGWLVACLRAKTDVKVADTWEKRPTTPFMVRTRRDASPAHAITDEKGNEHEIEDIDVVETERRGRSPPRCCSAGGGGNGADSAGTAGAAAVQVSETANALGVSVASDGSSSAGSTVLAQAQYTFSATVNAGPDVGQTISGTLMLKTEQEDDGN